MFTVCYSLMLCNGVLCNRYTHGNQYEKLDDLHWEASCIVEATRETLFFIYIYKIYMEPTSPSTLRLAAHYTPVLPPLPSRHSESQHHHFPHSPGAWKLFTRKPLQSHSHAHTHTHTSQTPVAFLLAINTSV